VVDMSRYSRLNQSVLSRGERPLLAWLAERIPAQVQSDHLTLLGVGGAFLAATGFVASTLSPYFLLLTPIGLLLNWLGDSLDGTLARLRGAERPQIGYFIDHTTDIVSQLVIGVGCGLSPYVRLDMACLALIGYLVLVAYTFIRANTLNETKISYFGVGPTEIRLFLIATSVYFYLFGNWTPWGSLRFSDGVAFSLFVVEVGCFIASATRDLGKLKAAHALRERPQPERESRKRD
jgi:archaetidylinositol phosphate synthase